MPNSRIHALKSLEINREKHRKSIELNTQWLEELDPNNSRYNESLAVERYISLNIANRYISMFNGRMSQEWFNDYRKKEIRFLYNIDHEIIAVIIND